MSMRISKAQRAEMDAMLKGMASGGRLTPEAVLAEAESAESPLHSWFEWDDTVAAAAYRLDQARDLIRSVVAKHVDDVIGPRYTSIGAVEGRLQMISISRYLKFGIAHSLSGKTINCRFFSYAMVEQIKAALGKRVMASGMVHYNAQDEPVRVDVEWLRVLRENRELPSIEEMGGSDPDFTGSLTTEEYIRSLRGGDADRGRSAHQCGVFCARS